MDIYNFAARYNCVPKISLRLVARPYRVQGRKLHEVTVELPEQGIKVTAVGNDLKSAEIAAGIRFKPEAEKYHAKHGEGSIIIKDQTALNTSNALKFFDFYRLIDNKARVVVETTLDQSVRYDGNAVHRSQVFLDDKPIGEAVNAVTRKKSEELASLTAAIFLKREDPSIYPRFVQALKAGNGQILKPIPPITMLVDEDCVLDMRDTLVAARRAGLPDEQDDLTPAEEDVEVKRMRVRHRLSPDQERTRKAEIEISYKRYCENPDLASLRETREALPMNQYRAQVLDIVNNSTYSIIVGATGSGKTTQVPQILLDNAIKEGRGEKCNIICTQPRRIAATSVARRVASERAERLQDSTGYHVRFDAKLPRVGGSITYCTTGILLLQLQRCPDEILDHCSYLIVDEVHERDILIDFLLIILKKTVARRIAAGKPSPKVVLMSATMDTDLFASYFKNSETTQEISDCPSLSVPGRTFPVKEFYLEDLLSALKHSYSDKELGPVLSDRFSTEFLGFEESFKKTNPERSVASESTGEAKIEWKRERSISAEDGVVSTEREDSLIPYGLVAMTIAHIVQTSKEGAILIFLPGLDEITKVDTLLRQGNLLGIDFNDQGRFKLFILHSSQATAQNEVFQQVPQGCRKIILATNIAETSVTIPEVQFVVDTGRHREKQYDQIRRITKLQCTWISKSNSKQRAGRAGRVQNGNYYALFSKTRYNSMRVIGLPEMLRSDLQEICLDIKSQGFEEPTREFLAEAIEPPAPKAVDASVLNLQALDALTEDEKLTSLGRILASLPVHPSLGKMIVLGIIFRCLDSMLILGAAAAERSLFNSPLEQRRAANEIRVSYVEGTGSDHIGILNAMAEARKVRDMQGPQALWDFARRNFIHVGAFRTIDGTAKQIEDILVEARLIPFTPPHKRRDSQFGDPSLNINSSKVAVIKALLLAGVHPNLAVGSGGPLFRTPGERATVIHPSSINSTGYRRTGPGDDKRDSLVVYTTMARSSDGSQIFLRDTSEATPLMATLFGGHLSNTSNVIEMDHWLPIYVRSGDRRAVKTIMEFRKGLERLLARSFRQLSDKKLLADDGVTEVFADGLVEVLKRDLGREDEESRSRRRREGDKYRPPNQTAARKLFPEMV